MRGSYDREKTTYERLHLNLCVSHYNGKSRLITLSLIPASEPKYFKSYVKVIEQCFAQCFVSRVRHDNKSL